MRSEMRMVFLTEDGKTFGTESEAAKHEARLIEEARARSKLRVVMVSHAFDATEGRGFFSRTYIVTDEPNSVVIEWCMQKFGRPLSAWYGDAYFTQWEGIWNSAMTVEEAIRFSKGTEGRIKTDLVLISKRKYDGLPDPQHPWPRAK